MNSPTANLDESRSKWSSQRQSDSTTPPTKTTSNHNAVASRDRRISPGQGLLSQRKEGNATTTPSTMQTSAALPTACSILQDTATATKRKSAFMPYRPQPTVLTNLQRGNTEATFCPVEVQLSFHERCGQGEITEQQHILNELERQSKLGASHQPPSVDTADSNGFRPLHWACFYGQLVTAQLLIDHKAGVDSQAPEMVTPLLLASCGGHHEIVRLLLEHGANAAHMDIVGNTALMYAAAGNHPHTCNELLARDPDMTATNEDGDSAYSLAIENGATLAQAVLEHYLSALLSL